MAWGENVVVDYAEDIEQWIAGPRRENKGEVSAKQAIPRHRRCRWEGSTEVRDGSGESRPNMSRDEWD